MADLLMEVKGIETLGVLRSLLADMDDDTPISNAIGVPLNLRKIEVHSVSEGGQYPPLVYLEID